MTSLIVRLDPAADASAVLHMIKLCHGVVYVADLAYVSQDTLLLMVRDTLLRVEAEPKKRQRKAKAA